MTPLSSASLRGGVKASSPWRIHIHVSSSCVPPKSRGGGVAGWSIIDRVSTSTSTVVCRRWRSCLPAMEAAEKAQSRLAKGITQAARRDSSSDDDNAPPGLGGKRDSHKYWTKVLEKVQKPSARQMMQNINYEDIMGVNTSAKGISTEKNSLYTFACNVKRRHPRKIAIVQVGEFFETWGTDAVCLVEWANLNPMGRGVPRAGFPLANLHRTLRDLTSQGFKAVICEELPNSNKGSRKERAIVDVVTPAKPLRSHGLVDEDQYAVDSGMLDMKAPPLVAVGRTHSGYVYLSADVECRRINISDRLTETAATSLIETLGHVPPLYVHRSFMDDTRRFYHSSPLMRMIKNSRNNTTPWEWFGGAEVQAEQMAKILKVELEKEHALGGVGGKDDGARIMTTVDAAQEWEIIPYAETVDTTKRPKPLHVSTAEALGLLRNLWVPGDQTTDGSGGAGVSPCLARSMLRKENSPVAPPALCLGWMSSILLRPPSQSAAQALRASCTALLQGEEALPNYGPLLASSRVVRLLREGEAPPSMLRDIAGACEVAVDVARMGAGRDLLRAALAVEGGSLAAEVERDFDRLHERLVAAWEEARRKINEVVDIDLDDESGSFGGGDEEGDDEGVATCELFPGLPRAFREINEARLQGKVKRNRLAQEFDAVDETRRAYEERIRSRLIPVAAAALTSAGITNLSVAAIRACLVHDIYNNAIWLKVKVPKVGDIRAMARKQLGDKVENLEHPRDRLGKFVNDRWSTDEVEEAARQYRDAVRQATESIRLELRHLGKELANTASSEVAAACVLCVVYQSLAMHVAAAKSRGWCIPHVSTPSSDKLLEVEGMIPHWMSRDSSAVSNDVEIRRGEGVIVTGPNMAGKSTLSRSIASAALLASCGLMAPAQRCAVSPNLKSVVLRLPRKDAPSEGRSAFAVEMDDLTSLLREEQKDTLVLLDEPFSTTEYTAACSLVGALLETYANNGGALIAATHLHGVLSLDMDPFPRLLHMEVAPTGGGGQLRPTWRLRDGPSTQSLALQVARDAGVPIDVLSRAAELGSSTPMPAPMDSHAMLATLRDGAAVKESLELNYRDMGSLTLSASTRVLNDNAIVPSDEADVFAFLTPQQMPSTAHFDGDSVLYVLRETDPSQSAALFYVGETDNFPQRVAQHRKSRSGPVEFAYIRVPEGRSRARDLEGRAIRALAAAGFPLSSNYDGRMGRS